MKSKFIKSTRKADIILYTIALFWLIALIWSSVASLEEVTRGEGRVIASSKMQIIQNLEGGIVEEIFVQTGDQVTTSQPLIKLEDIKAKLLGLADKIFTSSAVVTCSTWIFLFVSLAIFKTRTVASIAVRGSRHIGWEEGSPDIRSLIRSVSLFSSSE